MSYTVRDEPDFEPTYNEDDTVSVRKGDLRAVLDVATQSMDFGSGFLDNEQVKALRKAAEILGIDQLIVTPANFVCQYKGRHEWREFEGRTTRWYCAICRHTSDDDQPPEEYAS